MQNKPFSLKTRFQSFKYAFKGLIFLLKQEHNAWIHGFVAMGVLIAGIIFHISPTEWIAVIFAIGMVLSAEALNSAIESLADFVSPQHQKQIGKVKDLAAAAVLILAICAAIIGLIIFIPKIESLL